MNRDTTPGAPTAPASKTTMELVRKNVRDLLLQSDAFRALPPEQQTQIAKDTVQVAAFMAEPNGIRVARTGDTHPDPYAAALAEPQTGGGTPARASRPAGQTRAPDPTQEGVFAAQAAREGAAVAGALLQQVNFPDFVAGLVTGVFHSIVQSSMDQMEAYGRLVASVAMTLNQFRDENISENMGRDHLVDKFPDLFEIGVDTGDFGEGGGPRVRLREGVDESAAAKRVNGSLPVDGSPLTSLDNDTIEERLVPAARTQLATSRQQLLATMVLMGINRIVVTEGKIMAKVMYDFQARDNFRFARSATKFDYDPTLTRRTSEGDYDTSYEGGERTRQRDKDGAYSENRRDGSWYAKGSYKNTEEPVLKLASASQQTTDATLTTKASLAGLVEVNFKSDYLPLEKMADSFQIAMIQNAAKPSQGARGVLPGGQPAASSQPAGAPAPQAAPAT